MSHEQKYKEVTWKDLIADPEKYEGYSLWYRGDHLCVREHDYYLDSWHEYRWSIEFEFNDIDSFLLTMYAEKGLRMRFDFDLTDQQREHILNKLQSKWGNFRKEAEAGS